MAEYKFEGYKPNGGDTQLEIDPTIWGKWARLTNRRAGHMFMREHAVGTLVISDMTPQELKVVKRAVFAKRSIESTSANYHEPAVFNASEQVQKLQELADGTFRSQAGMRRDHYLALDIGNNIIKSGPQGTRYTSFAGNVDYVRDLMLAGIEDEYRKDGQAQEGHFVELATTANAMGEKIREIVVSGLLAVHGINQARLRELADSTFGPVLV